MREIRSHGSEGGEAQTNEPSLPLSVGQLLNEVEALSSDKQALADEVERLRKQLQQKKKAKTTADTHDEDTQESNSDHSSEKHRHKRQKPRSRPASDRRTFKDLTIHETIECPVDPAETWVFAKGRDMYRWPNRFFVQAGLFSLKTAHAGACQSSWEVKLSTGEPCAGDPHARFGGRGGSNQ